MLHYRFHGLLLLELTVPKALQGYVFNWERSNENAAFLQYLSGFSPFFLTLTTPMDLPLIIILKYQLAFVLKSPLKSWNSSLYNF